MQCFFLGERARGRHHHSQQMEAGGKRNVAACRIFVAIHFFPSAIREPIYRRWLTTLESIHFSRLFQLPSFFLWRRCFPPHWPLARKMIIAMRIHSVKPSIDLAPFVDPFAVQSPSIVRPSCVVHVHPLRQSLGGRIAPSNDFSFHFERSKESQGNERKIENDKRSTEEGKSRFFCSFRPTDNWQFVVRCPL